MSELDVTIDGAGMARDEMSKCKKSDACAQKQSGLFVGLTQD
jgi:hypothetical protein